MTKIMEPVPEKPEELIDVHSIQLAKMKQPESNVAQAINARKEGNFSLAMQLLEEELRTDCNNGTLYVEMAKVHRDRGEFEEMAAMVEKSSELLKGDQYEYEALVVKAELLVELGKNEINTSNLEEGIACLEKAIQRGVKSGIDSARL